MKKQQSSGLAVGIGLITWTLVYVATRATHWRISNGEELATIAAIGATLVVFSLAQENR